VGRVVMVERQVVAEQHESVRGCFQHSHQRGKRGDVLAVDLDQLQGGARGALGRNGGMRGLDQGRLAHASRAPQKHVVGGQGGRETARVVDKDVAHPIYRLYQRQVDAVDARHRLKSAPLRVPDEAVGSVEIAVWRWRRTKPFHGGDHTVELFGKGFQYLVRIPACYPLAAAKRGCSTHTAVRKAWAGAVPFGCNDGASDYIRAEFRPVQRARRFPSSQEPLMLVTPAFAQSATGGAPDMLVSVLPFVLIFVIMYFLIIRPQRTQQKRRAEMLAAIRRGDSVVT